VGSNKKVAHGRDFEEGRGKKIGEQSGKRRRNGKIVASAKPVQKREKDEYLYRGGGDEVAKTQKRESHFGEGKSHQWGDRRNSGAGWKKRKKRAVQNSIRPRRKGSSRSGIREKKKAYPEREKREISEWTWKRKRSE